MKEIWRDIEGYEGFYQVSNLGNVISLNYQKRGYAKILSVKCNSKGYLWYSLSKNGVSKPMLAHRLVAKAFLDNPNNYPQINHIDENPKNNRVDNLEWCTASYNVKYSASRHPERIMGRVSGRRTEENSEPYKYKRVVAQKTLNGEIVAMHENASKVAKDNNYSLWSILQCCRGKRKKAYGYRWEFTE